MKACRTILPIIVATALAGSPAFAADTARESAAATSAAGAGEQETAKDKKLICKRFNHSESRMKSFRACHTAAEWRQIERDR